MSPSAGPAGVSDEDEFSGHEPALAARRHPAAPAVIGLATASPGDEEAERVRVVTIITWGGDWPARRRRFRREFADLAADIVNLQETG